MDSQLTLVTLPPTVSLVFSHNSLKNATVFLGSRPVYIISTNSQNSVTEIRGAETEEVLVHIARNKLRADTIAFPTLKAAKEMRLTKWLGKCHLSDGSSTYAIDTEQGKFLLKAHPVHRLALFCENDLETPVAHWQNPQETSGPMLVMQAATWRSEACPEIMAAFVVREFNMRMAEKASQITLVAG
ncbi:hypothetical protein C8R43DRAFT_993966 [Mycena crocata]|nr:hypothetical protein C8R43DRAFT_993966 [Mycena crocata]